MNEFWLNMSAAFTRTFIDSARYKTFLGGFFTTINIAAFATVIGIIIGIVVAIIKVYNYHTGKWKLLNSLMDLYLTVFRGTPIVVQLMILYYIVFVNVNSGVLVAIISFGINSGAYLAEVVRAGILAVDQGQSEAGRSLGLSEMKTMRLIVLPQAFKNILPALFNEFIALLKETSVVGYIAVIDLTKAGDIVKSRTMDAFFPLISVALVYLVIVIGLTNVQKRIEKRLRKSDRR
ncbi:amino acid ABC transporter permease [Lachnospiraceae bacterium ZAX-1]